MWNEKMWVFVLVVACIIQTIAGDVVNQSPSIAMFCGKNSMHRDLTTGDWQPDPEGNANCTQDKAELFLYCKKMYPTLNISNIVSENSKVTIGPWCSLSHNGKCKGHNHQVTPVKCLVGTYESPALKVAASCKFNHKHDSSICKSHDYWADQALTACKKQNMRLEDNYSMLQACDGEPDQWRGVEYVCCPTTPVAAEKVVKKYAQDPLRNIMPILQGAGPVIIDQQQHPQASPVCSLPMLVGRCKAAFPRWYYNPQSEGCTQFVYGGCGGNGNNFESREECEQQCQVVTNSVKRDAIPVVEIKRDDDVTTDDVCSLPKLTGPCRALFHKFYFNKVTKRCELFVYGGCGGNGNNFESEEECSNQCQGQAPSTTTIPPTTTTTEELIVEEEVDVITDDVITDPDVENQQYLRARMEEDTWYSNQVSQVIADWGVENAAILKKWSQELEQKVQKDKLQKEFNRKIQELKETHDSNLERITTQHQTKMDAFIEEDRSKSYETFKQQIDVETPDSDMVLQSLELYLTSEKRGQDHIVTNFQLLFDDVPEISDEDAEGMRDQLQQKLNMIQSRAMETIALLNQHPQMKEEIQETIDQMFTSILPSQQLQLPTDDDSDSDDTIDQGGLPPQKIVDPVIMEQQQPMHMAASAAAWDGTSGNFDRSEEGIIRWISICCGCVALVVILAALARYYQANKLHHSQFTKIQVDDHLTVEEKQLLQMQQNGYENPTYKFFEKQQQHPQA